VNSFRSAKEDFLTVGDAVMATFEDRERVITSIREALDASGLDSAKVDITTTFGRDSSDIAWIGIHFRIGATGSHDNILQAIRDSTTFEQLAIRCVDRKLIKPPEYKAPQ
jgi:hypothetical protein